MSCGHRPYLSYRGDDGHRPYVSAFLLATSRIRYYSASYSGAETWSRSRSFVRAKLLKV